MSVASKKRRRAKRGGLLGHIGRVAARFGPPVDETRDQAFVRIAMGRHGVVLVGLEVSEAHFERLRAAFPNVRRERMLSPLSIVAVDLPPVDLLGPLMRPRSLFG